MTRAGDGSAPLTWRPDTYAVRGGLTRSEFDETAEAVFLTSGFVYDSAQQAEAAFKDEIDKFIYLSLIHISEPTRPY